MVKSTKAIACGKCLGKGTIQGFSHVLGGVCFSCEGKGTVIVAASHKSLSKFGCNYGSGVIFWIKARSEKEALRKAVAHWKRHASKPAFEGVTEDHISVVAG